MRPMLGYLAGTLHTTYLAALNLFHSFNTRQIYSKSISMKLKKQKPHRKRWILLETSGATPWELQG